MHISKLPYVFVFIQKQYPESYAFLFPRTLKLFAREVCKFLKMQANFQHILLFLNVCKQILLHISREQAYLRYIRGSLYALLHPGVRFCPWVKYFLFTCIFHPGVKSIHFHPGVKSNLVFCMFYFEKHSFHLGLNLIFCLYVKNSLFHTELKFRPCL